MNIENVDMRELKPGALGEAVVRHRKIVDVVTPTGVVRCIRPVAQQLLKQGVISGSVDGVLHAADAATLKAALMASAVCDFCSTPGADRLFDVPDFEMPHGGGRSTGGWMACPTCAQLVDRSQHKALLDRSVDGMSFSRFSRTAIKELHERFWKGMELKAITAGTLSAIVEYANGIGVDGKRLDVPVSQCVARLSAATGFSVADIERIGRADFDDHVMDRMYKICAPTLGMSPKQSAAFLMRGLEDHKPLADVRPHWQVALDRKFDALKIADAMVSAGAPAHYYSPDSTNLNDPKALQRLLSTADAAREHSREQSRRDADALRHAEAYSFNAETTAAILQAALTIPIDTPLLAIDTPGAGRAGWFWFQAPLAIPTCTESDVVPALLWYWASSNRGNEPTGPRLCFSVYVVDPEGKMRPSTFWAWDREETLEQLLANVNRDFADGAVLVSNDTPFGELETGAAVAALSRFFVAACIWTRQRIAVAAPQHVERHAKKRYVREHRLTEKQEPTVQVVALRRSERQDTEPHEPGTEAAHREWTCRWVVGGHPRMQPCGPGRKDRKLIWVSPFMKGPEGAPLRERKRVYAVVR